MSKPSYVIPSMAEIAALPWNGYNVVSTFSGTGGSCLGYRMAGYKVRWANEFVPEAQASYKLNHPDSILDTHDIRLVQGQDILRATGLSEGQIDIFDGSPPCASFSTSGSRENGWGKVKDYSGQRQRTDDLFFEYCRLIQVLQPKTFVAENVSGLVKGTAVGYFKLILQALKDCGYTVSAKLLNAEWLGVPQSRQRLIFIGVRNDLVARYGVRPVHPDPLPYHYTVAEVLPWIKAVRFTGKPDNWKDPHHPAPTILQSDGARKSATAYLSAYMVEADTDLTRYVPLSEALRIMPPDCRPWLLVKPHKMSGGKAVTERRKYTIYEVKRLSAFPDDFQLSGDFGQQWERIGRAVPPLMMKAVAATIQANILDKLI